VVIVVWRASRAVPSQTCDTYQFRHFLCRLVLYFVYHRRREGQGESGCSTSSIIEYFWPRARHGAPTLIYTCSPAIFERIPQGIGVKRWCLHANEQKSTTIPSALPTGRGDQDGSRTTESQLFVFASGHLRGQGLREFHRTSSL